MGGLLLILVGHCGLSAELAVTKRIYRQGDSGKKRRLRPMKFEKTNFLNGFDEVYALFLKSQPPN
jgi:hypothetical protein